MHYLGQIVSESDTEADPEKISTVKSWPTSTILKQLRSFRGFAHYYRWFIENYAAIAKPL